MAAGSESLLDGSKPLRERAGKEPLGVDISDYSDEFCAEFLRGQVNMLDLLADAGEQMRTEQRFPDPAAVVRKALSDLADIATRLALPLETPSLAEIMPGINDAYREGVVALTALIGLIEASDEVWRQAQ